MAWSYDDALAYLRDHHDLEASMPSSKADVPTLDRMRELCRWAGDPQYAQPVIHVTGTNGKGSTCRIVAGLLAATGLTVGTYSSPNLQRVNERLARNLEPIDDDELASVLEGVAAVEELAGVRANYFEVLVLAALRWFAETAVDVAVVEVGMGGRWDATNVVDSDVAVVTNVSLDHVEVIGPGRTDIAGEKAGIVRAGCTLVLGETDTELLPIFVAEGPGAIWLRDRDFGCESNLPAVGGRMLDLRTPNARHDDVFLSLHGAHQGDNAAAAVAAVEAFFERPLGDDVVREALGTATSPGRFEVVGRAPLVVLDGAHNAAGARSAAATLDEFVVEGDRILVVGCMRNHDPVELLQELEAFKARVVVATRADWPRAVPAEEVAAAGRALALDVEAVPSVADAVHRALSLASEDDLVFVTGSLYVVGEARTALGLR